MNFLKRLIEMAAPARVPVIEALTADAIETTETTAATDAEDRRQEKLRLKEILTCEESTGRETLAQHLAVSTDLSAAHARAILSASNREVPTREATKPDPFAKAVWTDPEPQREDAATQIRRIQAAYAFASGQPIPKS